MQSGPNCMNTTIFCSLVTDSTVVSSKNEESPKDNATLQFSKKNKHENSRILSESRLIDVHVCHKDNFVKYLLKYSNVLYLFNIFFGWGRGAMTV